MVFVANSQVNTPGILSCEEMRPFWVSWGGGLIKAGRGHLVDEDEIMSWQDSEPMTPATMSFTTGWGANGDWEFTNMQSKSSTGMGWGRGVSRILLNPLHVTIKVKEEIELYI